MKRRIAIFAGLCTAVCLLSTCTRAGDGDTKASSLAEMSAERNGLDKQFRELVAARRIDEAVTAAEKLVAVDRRIAKTRPADAGERRVATAARDEAIARMRWLVNQCIRRDEFLAAAARQRELADLAAELFGKTDYRSISERDNQAYYERLTALSPDAVRELLQADKDNTFAVKLYAEAKYSQAVPIEQRIAKTREEYLGPSSSRVAICLNNLGALYHAQGDYARAGPLFRQAAEIRKKALGENHPDYAISLNSLAQLYHDQCDYARAEPLYRQAAEIRRKALGENHPDYAATLNNLALLYQAQGDYARAGPLLRQATETWKKAVGENHPDYATSLDNLAGFYQVQGDYARAEPLYRQAAEIRKKVLGENHPDYAQSLNSLASLYNDQGDYARAEPLYRQAAEIRKKALGENHPDYATTLNNLALLYQAQGDYARAGPLLAHAAEIWKNAFGENHPDYARGLSNLAMLYRAQGDYARAEPLLRQAVVIWNKAPGANYPDYAQSLNDLGELYHDQSDYARAAPLYRQAAEIYKKALGENHPYYAAILNNLAALYHSQGDYARAEPLYRQAMEIHKKVFGENHPDQARGLNNLAMLYQAQGDYARAEPLLRQAVAVKKKALGEDHPDYAASLDNLAVLYRVQGDCARAEPLAREAASADFKNLEAAAVVQSQRQQFAMLNSIRSALDVCLGVAAESDRFAAETYRQMLAWKGLVFRRQRLARAAGQSPEAAALFRRLQSTAGQLAKLAWATPDPKQSQQWRKNVARIAAEKEQLEAELSNRSAEFRKARKPVTLEELQKSLPPGVAVVDCLEYSYYIPADRKAASKQRWERRFIAFVVRHDAPVARINLGPAKVLADEIDAWRSGFGATPPSAAAGTWLRKNLWEPIEAKIGDAKTVLISPDGDLARLPFAALPGRNPGSFLVEERALAVIPTAQIIPELVKAKEGKPPADNMLLVGNIDYDAEPARTQNTPAAFATAKQITPAGFAHFSALSGTREEMDSIGRLYHKQLGDKGLVVLQGGEATKAAVLREVARRRYLHLATHGFFIEEDLAPPPQLAQRGMAGFGDMAQGLQAAALHPGLLSGLALSGANRPPAQSDPLAPSDGADNQGMVTAEEIAAQNFDGVELAVLSACETGLGKSTGGEGLLGLQRAFQAAGVRTVVASLWRVDDKATQVLMVEFYKNLWQNKLGKLDALREAQLTMLRGYDPAGGRLRGPEFSNPQPLPAGGSPKPALPSGPRQPLSPAYWAAFVLSGDWR